MEYTYELNIQLIGLGISTIPKPLNDVYFQNIEDKLFATTRCMSESKDEIPKKTLLEATDRLDLAAMRLSFIYGFKISLSKSGYLLKRLFEHSNTWVTLSTLSSPYAISVDHDKLAKRISLLDPEMSTVLNQSLGYYEAALESTNQYIKTLLLVSCSSALIRKIFQLKTDVKKSDLKAGFDGIRKRRNISDKAFDTLISNIYDRGRSRPAHGNIDVKSNTEISLLTEDYELFHQMVRELIVDFSNRNHGNIGAVPKI